MASSPLTFRLRVMIVAVSVSGLLMAIKFVAYGLTNSAAILSDALESIINMVASGFALYSIYLANRPPDDRHPYGHGKIEDFSAGFEGALIILAAMAILYKAISALVQDQILTEVNLGILLILGTSVLNLCLGLLLVRTGRKTRSSAIEADGKHLLTDVYTSVGVVLGLALVRFTGWQGWDPLVAGLVAVNILFAGWRLVSTSFGRLMDEADPELLGRIVDILNEKRRPDWIEIHQLRARRYGDKAHVDFHLIVPRSYGLLEAHDQAKEIEGLILGSLGEVAEVIVHVDPCEDPLCAGCLRDPCEDRTLPKNGTRQPWLLEQMVSKRAHKQ